MEYRIDASNKILGRLASQIALLLRGKDSPHFDPARAGNNKVIVFNTDKLGLSGKKIAQKLYRRHSGYHGGLKEKKLSDLITKDSCLVLRLAVQGMLPKNRSRQVFLKNLILFKGEEK